MSADRLSRTSRKTLHQGRPIAEILEQRQLLAIITVNTTLDSDGTAGTTTLSLRQAIEISNGTLDVSALTSAQAGLVVGRLSFPNTIDFNIPGSGPFTIAPTTELRTISDPVIIDGYSQPGSHPNTNGPGLADNATLMIALVGSSAPADSNGLDISAGVSTVQGLAIGGFGTGILLEDSGDDLIQGVFVGTDVTGTQSLQDRSNGVDVSGSSHNTIGGTTAAARNVIADGLSISPAGVTSLYGSINYVIPEDNLVEGNFIGTNVTGSEGLLGRGIETSGVGDTIGGTTSGAGNLISGNESVGVTINYVVLFDVIGQNLVPVGYDELLVGNLVGTDVSGTKALPNGSDGINFFTNETLNSVVPAAIDTIGGTTAGARNVISGNMGTGIYLGMPNILVEGNFIGTDVYGTSALPNADDGIANSDVAPASGNTIGGTMAGAGNLISGNTGAGISLVGPGNLVEGNFIGTNIEGTKPLENVYAGVALLGLFNTIGGTVAGARNLISGNGIGVDLVNGSDNDVVEGNLVGTDITGTQPLPNNQSGVEVDGSYDTIGGTTPGSRNLISGNTADGVNLVSSNDLVAGNLIGTDVTGTKVLPNGSYGIEVEGSNSTIGGSVAGARNVISGNAKDGVALDVNRSDGIAPEGSAELIQGNLIGTDLTGTEALPNQGSGIRDAAGSTTIGGTSAGARNVISGNAGDGVIFDGSTNALIEGNFIGTDITGTNPTPNLGSGIETSGNSVGSTIGGTTAGAGNVISGNIENGITITSVSNLVEGNRIGTDVTGTVALPNSLSGIQVDGGGSTIGGTTPGSGNLISGNVGNGLTINGIEGLLETVADDLVEGNILGADFSGVNPLPNGGSGIEVTNTAGSNFIGGTVAGAANVIAFNQGSGVLIIPSGTSFSATPPATPIFGNSIFGNEFSGIFDGYGATLPTLVSAVSGADGTEISGMLHDSLMADDGFTIEFFSNAVHDPAGFGQGQTYLGSTFVTTDDSGHASFTFTTGLNLNHQYISATATSSLYDDTSGFAQDLLALPTLPTTTTLTGPAMDSIFGRPTTFTATVSQSSGIASSGFVDFIEDGVVLGEVPVDAAGQATFVITQLTLNRHSIAASYLGDPTNSPSLSNSLSLFVKIVPTTTSLNVPTAPLYFGLPATFSATVSQGSSAVTTGYVAIYQGGVELGAVPVNASGVATLVTDLLFPGTEVISASYLGSYYDPSSVSTAASLFVQRLPTTTTLIGPATSSVLGQQAAFTATETQIVGVAAPGFVSFLDGGVVLATVPVGLYGVATFVTTSLSPGIHSITASYVGDTFDAPSVSNPVSQQVLVAVADNGPTVTSTLIPTSNSVVITFSRSLLIGPAQSTGNYVIIGPNGHAVTIASAVYDAVDDSVTLTTRGKLEPGPAYRLTIDGKKVHGVSDTDRIALDGKNNNRPGSNYSGTVVFHKASHPLGPKKPGPAHKKA